MSVILVIHGAEFGRIMVPIQPGEIVHRIPSQPMDGYSGAVL
jgi:hypothetical protein